jgi:hypothetical protein
MFIPSTSIFILTHQNKKWSARYFGPNNNWRTDGKKVIEISVDQSKLNQLWAMLVLNNVLTLPSQESIKTPMVKYEIDTTNLGYGNGGRHLHITDGVVYNFELIASNKSKYYSYHCPQTFLNHYSNIVEFYNVSVIILLINRYLGLVGKAC